MNETNTLLDVSLEKVLVNLHHISFTIQTKNKGHVQ